MGNIWKCHCDMCQNLYEFSYKGIDREVVDIYENKIKDREDKRVKLLYDKLKRGFIYHQDNYVEVLTNEEMDEKMKVNHHWFKEKRRAFSTIYSIITPYTENKGLCNKCKVFITRNYFMDIWHDLKEFVFHSDEREIDSSSFEGIISTEDGIVFEDEKLQKHWQDYTNENCGTWCKIIGQRADGGVATEPYHFLGCLPQYYENYIDMLSDSEEYKNFFDFILSSVCNNVVITVYRFG